MSETRIVSKRLETAERPIRLVHISDLHLSGFSDYERLVIDKVNSLQPDLICITGDFFKHSRVLEEPNSATFKRQAQRFSSLQTPWLHRMASTPCAAITISATIKRPAIFYGDAGIDWSHCPGRSKPTSRCSWCNPMAGGRRFSRGQAPIARLLCGCRRFGRELVAFRPVEPKFICTSASRGSAPEWYNYRFSGRFRLSGEATAMV